MITIKLIGGKYDGQIKSIGGIIDYIDLCELGTNNITTYENTGLVNEDKVHIYLYIP